MEYKELKKKSKSDLHRILNESRDKLRELKFKDANKQLKDIRQIRKIRVTIAQCLTLLKQKDKMESINIAESTGSENDIERLSLSGKQATPTAEKKDNK